MSTLITSEAIPIVKHGKLWKILQKKANACMATQYPSSRYEELVTKCQSQANKKIIQQIKKPEQASATPDSNSR